MARHLAKNSVAVGRHTDAWIALALVVLSMGWCVSAIYNGPELSRLDEWTYIDYAWKVSHGHIPVSGEPVGQEALTEWSCRGMEGTIRHVSPPPCADVSTSVPADWPYKGENYNAFHPPVYFALAGVTARVVSAVTGVSFVVGTRLFSGFMVALGIAALYGAIRRWKVGQVASAAGALLVLATPGIAASAAMMHSEAANALAGAAAVWWGARVFVEHKLDWKLPALATLLISLTRTISLTGMLSILALVFLCALWPHLGGLARSTRKKLWIVVATQVVSVVVGYVPWTLWQNSRTPAHYVADISGYSTEPFAGHSLVEVARTLFGAYGLTEQPYDWYLQPHLSSTVLQGWSSVLFWFYMLLPFVALLAFLLSAVRRVLAGSALIGPLVAGVVVQGRELLTNHAYFRVFSARYALATVPLFGATAAALFDRRILRWIFLAFAGVSYIVLMASPFLPYVSKY